MKSLTTAVLISAMVFLSGCATTTTTHVNEDYDRPVERLLVIVGFQSIYGPFGHPDPGNPVPPLFLSEFETALTERWEAEDLAVLVDAVTVDGQVDLVGLMSQADPDTILLVEQTAADESANYTAVLFDAPTGDKIWEGEYTGDQTEAEAVAKLMHTRVNQGTRQANLAIF